jgi:hypothetical protein
MNRTKSGALFLCLCTLVATGCILPVEGRADFGGESGEGGKGGQGQGGEGGARTSTTSTGTVVDTTPPKVLSTSPADGASKVLASAVVVVKLSEALDPATLTGASFTLTGNGAAVAGTVSLTGATVVFTPTADLPLDVTYAAKLSTAVTDLAGNKLSSPLTWSFATAVRPTVTGTSPADADTGVATTRQVTASFSVQMDATTLSATTFVVRQGGTPVPGTVTAAGATATFAPMVGYPPSTKLTATITTGARDLAGNGLAKDHFWTFQTGSKVTQLPVKLGLASTFGVLAGDEVANTVSVGTIVTGDLGISPGATLSGFPPGVITGGMYTGVAAAPFQALVLAAYNDASKRPGGAALPADLAGLTFTPGLYHQDTAVALSTGTCTLDAQGDSSAVFVFQVGTAFSLAANTQIALIGGAKAANVTWAVGASVTLGAGSKLAGTLLAATAITLGAGAKVDGRLLAHGASVTLDTNLITVPAP